MAKNGDKPGKLSVLENKGRVSRSWDRILKAQYLLRPVTIIWIINLGCGLLLLGILGYPGGKPIQKVYNLPEKEGEPVIAVRDFKIPYDLEVPDLEGTEKKKAEAEAKTKSIYDYDPLVPRTIKKQVSDFFAGFRELYPPPAESPNGRVPSPDSAPITVPATFLPEKEQELLRGLGITLSPEELDALKSSYFSRELEEAVIGLIESVYAAKDNAPVYVVPNRDLLLKEKDKGVVARLINASPETPPLEINTFDSILDIQAGQEIIDKAVQDKLKKTDPEVRPILVKMAKGLIDPNLTFNKDKTEEAKALAVAAAKPLYYKFKKDEVIVRKGDRLPPDKLAKINAIQAAQQGRSSRSVQNAGVFTIIIFMIATVAAFARRNVRKFILEPKDLVFLALVLVLSLGVFKVVDSLSRTLQQNLVGIPEGMEFYYLVPLAGAVMLVRMVLNSEIALVFAIILSLLAGIAVDNSLLFGIYTLTGSVVAAGEVRQCRQRTNILRAGLVLGLVNVLLILAISMVNTRYLSLDSFPAGPFLNSLLGFLGGIFISIVVTGVVPLAEYLFSYATDIKLLELLNQDQPLLKELSMRSPGTLQHSLMVANLSEAAAKAIGANPLLARVCAMYHDIGKMNKPLYFAENQWDGENVHDRLSPSMSTLIIHNHVREGAEMAEKQMLPRVVIEAIKQHHGTGLLKFFYEKAKELNETGIPVEETEFRYPGPKPQTRETAIILLADVVESAARTVRDPSPARLQGMVQKLINRFFIDGQLDECDLTLKNLHEIARSFNLTLGAIYHQRPDYPQSVVKGTAPERKKKAEAHETPSKDKGHGRAQEPDEDDQEESENYLRRLGM